MPSSPKTVTITKTYHITRCYDCPYFEDHPHEPSCDHPDIIRTDAFAGIEVLEDRRQMQTRRPEGCPLDNGSSK